MTRMRVALLQLASHGANVPTALVEGERWCRSAAALGADVALLPELWQVGYQACPSDPAGRAVWTELATEEGEPFVERFRALAVELRMAIVVTYLQRRPGEPRNAATLIDRDGRTLLTYAKVHTCDFAGERFLTPGTEFPVAELALDGAGAVTVGVMTCFDREHPEAARALMLGGAEVMLVPNACVLDDERIGQVRARAFENMAGIAVANYAAPGAPPPEDPGPANGHSVAFSGVCYRPDGRPRSSKLVEAGEDECVSIATFDLDALRAYRTREPWGDAYRRPAAYGRLLTRAADARMRRPDPREEEVRGDGALAAGR